MRDCVRNQRPIWYAPYLGKEEVVVDGVRTGQNRRVYADPSPARVAVSACAGESDVSIFGKELQYDRTMTSTRRLPIDEYSRVWIDKTPDDGAANYEVKRAAFGLNQHIWALAKVVGE